MSKKNKYKSSIIIGFGIIILSLLLSVFAYLFIPDKTINANDQIPSLALQSPGFSVKLFKYPVDFDDTKNELLSLITGQNIRFQHIPITDWKIEGGDFIYFPLRGMSKSMAIADLVPDKHLAKAKKYITNNLIEQRTFLFGTDKYGRDIFSRIILGMRISLFVGFIAVLISIVIGTLIGMMAGYFGGRIDHFVQYLINTFWSIPTILLVFAIVAGFGRSITVIFIAVGLTMWVDVARLVRGQVLSLKEKNYVRFSRSVGTSHWGVIFKHILPNILSSLFVIGAANFAIAILIEAGLSYLGFGVQPPVPSLGNMLNENYGFALSGKIFMAIIPATVIMLLVLAFNLAGNGLRDIFDVKD